MNPRLCHLIIPMEMGGYLAVEGVKARSKPNAFAQSKIITPFGVYEARRLETRVYRAESNLRTHLDVYHPGNNWLASCSTQDQALEAIQRRQTQLIKQELDKKVSKMKLSEIITSMGIDESILGDAVSAALTDGFSAGSKTLQELKDELDRGSSVVTAGGHMLSTYDAMFLATSCGIGNVGIRCMDGEARATIRQQYCFDGWMPVIELQEPLAA